jgi:CO/xanthine dehydrogenase FAD-binding subunit
MTLPAFEMVRPGSLRETLEVLAAGSEAAPQATPRAMTLAGGTNLIVDLRSGKHRPGLVVDVSGIDELRGVERTDREIVIGATTTIAELLHDATLAEVAPVLVKACSSFANALIRNRATIGGNLVNAAPCCDTAPALLVLGAEVKLASVRGTRRMPLEAFLTGAFTTARKPDELLTSVRFPIPSPSAVGAFRKMGLRKISCMAKVDVAVLLDGNAEVGCTEARIAIAAASPVAVRAHDAEKVLVGHRLTPDRIDEAARRTAEASEPRTGSEYKLHVVRGLARRLLQEAADGLAYRGGRR